MRRMNQQILIATFGICSAVIAQAGDTLRCGRYIVNTGDTQARVLQLCGEPQRAWQDGYIEQTERRKHGNTSPSPYDPKAQYEQETRRVIPVFKWEYNFGRGTFLKTLVFHSDNLIEIIDGARQ